MVGINNKMINIFHNNNLNKLNNQMIIKVNKFYRNNKIKYYKIGIGINNIIINIKI